GRTEYEFYTSRDFPTITKETEFDKYFQSPDFLNKLLPINKLKDYATLTQGYVAISNNMHGIMKATRMYAEGADEPLSGTEYYYRTKGTQLTSRRDRFSLLDNDDLTLLYADNQVGKGQLGQQMELVLDSREHLTKTRGGGLSGNADISVFPPAGTGIALPNITNEDKRFRSLVLTKLVNQTGIMDSIVVIDNGARVSTKHLAYDAQTGQPLISQVTNEYRDPLYSMSMPAHWTYDGMGQAFKNQGVTIVAPSLSTNLSFDMLPDADKLFVPGDELMIGISNQPAQKGWVMEVGATSISVVDQSGTEIPVTTEVRSIKVLRSGRRNQSGVSVGSFSFTQNPIQGTQIQYSGVLNASANEFSERWQTLCEYPGFETECLCENPTSQAATVPELLITLQNDGFLFNGTALGRMALLNTYPVFTQSTLAQTLGFDPAEDWFLKVETRQGGGSCIGADLIIYKTNADCSLESVCIFLLQFSQDCANLEEIDRFEGFVGAATPSCASTNDFVMRAIAEGAGVNGTDLQINMTGTSPCVLVKDCGTNVNPIVNCRQAGDVVNPYVAGVRGTWLPKKGYTYLTERTNTNFLTNPNPATDIRRDGVWVNFQPFWQYVGNT
ncbi:MAG: hypothetical protein AAFR59_10665, partial [Bacteroidota bacterium]